MLKPLFHFTIIFLIIILAGCSAEDSGSSENPDNPTEEGQGNNNGDIISLKLDPEVLNEVDYGSLNIYSSNESTYLNQDGTFEIFIESEEPEELPILFVQGDEVIFGFYQKSLSDDIITLDNIIIFYLKIYPEIAIREISSTDIALKVQDLSNRSSLLNQLKKSISDQQNPLNDPEFIESLEIAADNILEHQTSDSESMISKEYIEDFKIDYKRNGKITVTNQSPFFAAMGFKIEEINTNYKLTENNILPPKIIALSPGSYSDWIGQKLFPEAFTPQEKKFTLNKDGEYIIEFTNGNGQEGDLAEFVVEQNQIYFAKLVIAFAIPQGLKKLFGKSPECVRELDKITDELITFSGNFQLNSPSTEDLTGVVINTSTDVVELVVNCIEVQSNFGLYFKLLTKLSSEILTPTKSITELSFFSRDYFGSEINISETRYFDNEVSYGSVKLEDISGNTFNGFAGEEILYEAKVSEIETIYEVHRNTLYSELIKKESFQPANQLPFNIELLTGDAIINDGLLYTDFGVLFATIEIGLNDSEIEISPAFNTKEISEENLVVKHSLEGVWDMVIFYDEVPVGEYFNIYSSNCTNILEAKETMYGNFTFKKRWDIQL